MEEIIDYWHEPVELVYSNKYIKEVYDSALMYACFGWEQDLFDILAQYTPTVFMLDLIRLYCSYPLYVRMNRGNIIISNYEKEEETIRHSSDSN